MQSDGEVGPPGLNKSTEIGSPADRDNPGSSNLENGLANTDSEIGRLIKTGVKIKAARFFISS